MHFMNQMKTVFLSSAAMALIPVLALIGGLAIQDASVFAQPPRMQNADLDFAASGFLMPPGANPANAVQQAGMVGQMASGAAQFSPTPHSPTQFAPAGYNQPMPSQTAPVSPTGVSQVGFFSGGSACSSGCCGGGGCDSMGSAPANYAPNYAPMGGCYDGSCGMGMMPGGCGGGNCGGGAYQQCDPILTGGIVGKMRGEGDSGGENLSGLRHICMFCRGGGCSACQSFRPGALLGALAALKPYSEAGLCAQRWYDLSVEAMFLGNNAGSIGGGVTSQGVGGPIVLASDDTGLQDLEGGVRLSAAFILGPGGNLEGTYIGGHDWGGTSSVQDPNGNLFSFISDFGALPVGATPAGFDDTDRSTSQTVSTSARFNSAELNYRRRTVGPYCRFQGSWLVGLRYLQFDNGQNYQAVGGPTTGGGFFNSDSSTENDFFGAQLGGDLWWNIVPGVSMGMGAKGAWGQNDRSSTAQIISNSSGIPAFSVGTVLPFEEIDRDTTVMGEFELKSIYRLNHDWTFRSSYYLVALDNAAQAGFNTAQLIDIANGAAVENISTRQIDSVVIQGFSFGAEYTW